MDKSQYKIKTIDNQIVVDGLSAISYLDKSSFSKDNSFVVGGVATQSYLPSSLRRGTADIDLAVMIPLTNQDFKNFAKPLIEYLQDKKYSVEEKKGHNAYMVVYRTPKEEEVQGEYIIEFARRNANNISRIKGRLEREFENTRIKRVEGRTEQYKVASPEDIVTPKLVRGVRALREYPELKKDLRNTFPLTNESILDSLKYLGELREEVSMLGGDIDLANRLRFNSDVHDISVLSELVGFNTKYLKESISSWDVLTTKSPERNSLLKCLIPELL